MKVPIAAIRPELRAAGLLFRTLWPRFTERKFRFCNRVLDGLFRGHVGVRGLSYEQVCIERPDATRLRLCIYRPKENARRTDVPGVLWLHGGGIATGVPEQDAHFAKRLIDASACTVVMPDYRRSLEAPYPAALEDCYLALVWLRDHAADYGARPAQLFVGGDSAGGGLTAALCLYARDRGEVSIAFQMPLYPMLDDRDATDSARENDAPVWNAASNALAWRLYLGAAYQTADVPVTAAPGRATQLQNLPPMLTFVGSVEPFCDETVRYAAQLEAFGVPARCKVFEGCFHAFDLLGFSRVAKEARAFLSDGFCYAAAHYDNDRTERIVDGARTTVVSVACMRASDADTIARLVPGETLMWRAAMGVFTAVDWHGKIGILAGGGNNGGDGFALACILHEHGMAADVFRTSRSVTDTSAHYLDRAREAGVSIRDFNEQTDLSEYAILVDCILGTGFSGTVRGLARAAIEAVNAAHAYVVSVDINSGLNGDTGTGACAVQSDLTVSIGFYKKGLFCGDAPKMIQKMINVPIGIELKAP